MKKEGKTSSRNADVETAIKTTKYRQLDASSFDTWNLKTPDIANLSGSKTFLNDQKFNVSNPSSRLATQRKFYEEVLSEAYDEELSLAEYIRSLHNNSYTLEALLLLGLLDKGTKSLYSARIMSYKSFIVKHQLFGVSDVGDCRKAVCTAGNLDLLPRFVRYSSVRSLNQLTEIYKVRNVDKFTGVTLCLDTFELVFPSTIFPKWKQLWVIYRNGSIREPLPPALEVLELSGFEHAMNVNLKDMVQGFSNLSIFISDNCRVTDNCSITSTVYNTLPSKHKLKVLICLDMKCM
uniref:LRR domain containing protein n=1 Tax=Strongyloides papillosus TaxID=174720 RepID=A0A0N5C2Q2_STREA